MAVAFVGVDASIRPYNARLNFQGMCFPWRIPFALLHYLAPGEIVGQNFPPIGAAFGHGLGAVLA